MNRIMTSFRERVEQNSKNYAPAALFDLENAQEMLTNLHELYSLETLMTDRHGNILMTCGSFDGFKPDVVNRPGNKIRVKGRTVCHIYTKYDSVAKENIEAAQRLINTYIRTLELYSEKSYMAAEQEVYIDELEQHMEKESDYERYSEHNDPLTGVLNRNRFISVMKELARAETVPTAVICANINDWRFVDTNFGEEESDRLIVTIADIIKRCAVEAGIDDAVIGRVEGDVFNILLPMTEQEEASRYCDNVINACNAYEDRILAPSVAIGMVMRTCVEQDYKELLSDAEYAMLEHKFETKNAPGYRQRLEKGLNLK